MCFCPAVLFVRNVFVFLLAGLVVTGCMPDTDENQGMPDRESQTIPDGSEAVESSVPLDSRAEADSADEKPKARVLDLSLPKDISLPVPSADMADLEEPERRNLFEGEDLFNKEEKKKDKDLSVTVRPMLQPGEELTDPSEVDGATVGVKVKTK